MKILNKRKFIAVIASSLCALISEMVVAESIEDFDSSSTYTNGGSVDKFRKNLKSLSGKITALDCDGTNQACVAKEITYVSAYCSYAATGYNNRLIRFLVTAPHFYFLQ